MDRGNPRRLLFFAYYFPPLGGAGSRRALSFAVHLRDLGWEVVVVTPREGVYGRDPSLLDGGLDGVEVLRTGTWEPSVLLKEVRGRKESTEPSAAGGAFVEEAEVGVFGGAVRSLARKLLYFPDSARGWVRPAVAAALKSHERAPASLVLGSSPPVSAHVAAARFSERTGVPLVLDFRDLWEPAVAGRPPKARRLMDELLSASARVVTVSEGYADWFEQAGARPRPGVVFNGFEEARPRGGAAAGDGEYLIHAGTTYAGRQDFRPLGEAIARAAKRTGRRIRLRLVGRVDSATRDALAGLASSGTASLEPFRRSDEVAALESGALAVVVHAWSGAGPAAAGHLPAKLFEALPSGKPILLLADAGSEAERFGGKLGLAAVPPTDAARLDGVLDALLNGAAPAGTRPDPRAADRYTRAAQAALLRDVLEEVRAAGSGR